MDTLWTLLFIFLIIGVGYLLGNISIKGVSLGSAMILMVALVAGHYGVVVDPLIRNLGLVLFVGAVGLIAGPVFISNFKSKALPYVILGIAIGISGIATTFITSKLFGVSVELALGVFSGSLTSTPGLAAAKDISESVEVTAAYGITYLFGVVGVVLFVQLIPKILKKNISEEVKHFEANLKGDTSTSKKEKVLSLRNIEPTGLFAFALTMVLGILLGMISIPLPGGKAFSLGATGGTLFMGLIIGHIKHVGPYSLKPPMMTLKTLRELGLILFLIGAGSEAGAGFIEVVQEYGIMLFFQGMIVTTVPMIVAVFVVLKILKLDIITGLGAICGGMTSTPALAALVDTTSTDEVAIPYAATYPVGMILVILGTQLLDLLL
jgi:Predicted permease